jgi:hypothetical protein
MSNVLFRRVARLSRARFFRTAAACLCASAVWAPAVPAAEPRAAEPEASAPFKRYQGWRDEPLQDWRQANERVGEVGGWRTYLRESQPAGDATGLGRHGPQGMEEAP